MGSLPGSTKLRLPLLLCLCRPSVALKLSLLKGSFVAQEPGTVAGRSGAWQGAGAGFCM